jgi:hypothetical protein
MSNGKRRPAGTLKTKTRKPAAQSIVKPSKRKTKSSKRPGGIKSIKAKPSTAAGRMFAKKGGKTKRK